MFEAREDVGKLLESRATRNRSLVLTFPLLVKEISRGVKAVALSRKFLRSASVVLLVGRGSYRDPIEGCACLDSRMRLRVTSRFSPLRLQVAMDRIGATIEAVTDRDCMFLRAQVPSKKVEECLKLLAELYMFPSFPEQDVDRERGSEKLEYERIRQDPMTASMTDVWEATFPQNPLGHPVTGYPSTIEKITPKTLDEFDEKVREDAPLVVAVVGPQEENMIIEFADSCFEKVKVKPRVEKINPRPRRDFNILRSALRAKQTTFTVGTVTSGASSSDYPALLLLEDYLGSERHYAGTLFRELREKRGLTYFAGSRLFALRDCGLLTAYTGVEHEKVSEALRLMLQCMTELRDKDIPEKMMEELKIFHRQVVEVMLEVPFRAAIWLATNIFRGAEVDLESYISKIQTVMPENIRRVAEGSLTASCMALSASGNPPDEKTLAKIMRGEMG